MTRKPNAPPSSSPVPIRETQPQVDSPTTTTRGIERGHALYDTPPPGTQPPELQRSARTWTMSTRQREHFEYEGKLPPSHQSHDAHPPAEPKPASRSANPRQRNGKPAKRPVLEFDSTSDDEPVPKKPRKTRNHGTPEHSPPPKPPGRGAPVAGSDRVATTATTTTTAPTAKSVTLKPRAARELGKLLGFDPSTATSGTIQETIWSLSDHRAPQMGPSERYTQFTQVRGETPTPIPSLNKKAGYHRDRLRELAHPQPSQSEKPGSVTASKRARIATDDANADDEVAVDDPPTPPCLPNPPLRMQFSPDLPSASSTQRAVVNAFASQGGAIRPSPPVVPSQSRFQPSPVPEPHDKYTRHAQNKPTTSHPKLATSQQAPKPTTHPAAPSKSLQPKADAKSVPPDPNTATESETESEPMLQRKRHTRPCKDGRADACTSGTTSKQPPPQPRRASPTRQPHDPLLPPRRDSTAIVKLLAVLLAGGNTDALDQAHHLLIEHQRMVDHGTPPAHAQPDPGPSSTRTRRDNTPDNNTPDGEVAKSPSDDEASALADDDDDPPTAAKSGLSKYPGTRGKAGSRAIPKLLATATSKGVYQEQDTYIRWARNAYRRAWKEFFPHIPYREPPLDLLRTIVSRASNLRTKVKERIRAVISYMFGFVNPGSDENIVDANR
ncbi:hypothetical protein FRC06_008435, partial [Ceratobasidium sp. 370]